MKKQRDKWILNNNFTIGKNIVDGACNAWNIFTVPRPPAPVLCNILKKCEVKTIGPAAG